MTASEYILSNDKLLDRLAMEYAQVMGSYYGNGKRGTDSEAKKEMAYFLNQHAGFCSSPDSLGKQLMKIWDKIQERARKYGYDGPIYQPRPTSEELPSYLKRVTENLRNSPELMNGIARSYYFGHSARDWSQKNEWSLPYILIKYPEYTSVVGHLSFKEAKMILKYLEKDIKAEAKRYGKQREAEKNALTEAVYKRVLKKLIQHG